VAEGTKSVVRQRTADILRIIARVIGIIIIVFFLIIIIGEGIQEGFLNISVESLYVLIPTIVAVAAFILSWWRELLGGILLVVAYLLFSFSPSIHSLSYKENPQFYTGMFLYALPLFVSGVLFILASWLNGKKILRRKQSAS
jgi:hypothetical protein